MANELTEKQRVIFDYMKSIISDTGFPPTVREVADRFEMTAKGAYDHIKAIEKKGFIKCGQNKSRAIEILVEKESQSSSSVSVPVLGSIAAGMPILAEENIEEYIDFPKQFVRGSQCFALRVRGDSMIDAGIFDGDFALIRVQNSAENGEIVAALLDGEATLKRFSYKGSDVRLLPANEKYKPIVPETLTILGKLAGLFRAY